mmetsp:Transcript_24437/g.41392  ORF Transcript_24437/g.41392 Transcript_24437/m.41392 type:complete len:503 (+) Transcript_24437:199-1707(+)
MKAMVNETVDDKTLLSQYREEINELKAQLAKFQEMSATNSSNGVVKQSPETTTKTGPETDTVTDAENVDEDTEQNQRLILQMIGHMERLILKGENGPSTTNTHTSPIKGSKIDRRRSDASTFSSSTYRRKGTETVTLVNNGFASEGGKNEESDTLTTLNQSIGGTNSLEHEDTLRSTKGSSDSADKEPNFKTTPAIVIENPFKNIIEENIPVGEVDKEGENENGEELDVDDDDYFAGLSRLSVCGSPCRSRSSSSEKHPMFSPSTTRPLMRSPPSGMKKSMPDKKSGRQPFVINPRRVTMSFGEGGMRKLTRNSESEETPTALTAVHSTNPATGGDPTLDDIMSGSLKEDPVLYGVSQMLSILKQHVTKPKVKHPPTPSKDRNDDIGGSILPRQSVGSVVPEANTKALHDEIARLQENVDKKDSMLTMLTEGLKEVEVNQAALLTSNEQLGEELHITQQAYYEVEEENKLIRAEVERLQKCLDMRESQLFEVTGKKPEEEEF